MHRLLAVALAAFILAAACSDAGPSTATPGATPSTSPQATGAPTTGAAGSPTPSTTTTTTAASGTSVPATVASPPVVAGGDAVDGPGTHRRSVVLGDIERSYVLHIATGAWTGRRVPLVIDLHGLSSTPENQDELSGFRIKADEEGFVVAQPQADGILPTWQAGVTPSPDVDLLRAIMGDVALHVDLGPVFIAGFSNGGGMAHRFACDAPSEVAAIGTVAGAYPDTGPCAGAVPVIAFHGVHDRVVPFDGAGFLLPDVVEWASAWADRAGCAETTLTSIVEDVEHQTWGRCASGSVELYIVADGGHGWPGTRAASRLLASTDVISATDLMWEFFIDSLD